MTWIANAQSTSVVPEWMPVRPRYGIGHCRIHEVDHFTTAKGNEEFCDCHNGKSPAEAGDLCFPLPTLLARLFVFVACIMEVRRVLQLVFRRVKHRMVGVTFR